MEIVGNLHAQSHREGWALRAGRGYAHCPTGGAFGHPRDQKVFRGDQHATFHFAELHPGVRVVARLEATAVDSNVAAGDRRAWRDPFNPWCAVGAQNRSSIVAQFFRCLRPLRRPVVLECSKESVKGIPHSLRMRSPERFLTSLGITGFLSRYSPRALASHNPSAA